MRLQGVQTRAQGRFERPDVEDHAFRAAHRDLAQDLVGRAERRRDHDEIVREPGCAPVWKMRETGRRSGGVGDFDRETLGCHEIREPAAHLAGAADDQRGPPAAGARRRHTRLLLGS
jgi:hypothetical protein